MPMETWLQMEHNCLRDRVLDHWCRKLIANWMLPDNTHLVVDINLTNSGSSSNLIRFGIWICKDPVGWAFEDGCPLLQGGSLTWVSGSLCSQEQSVVYVPSRRFHEPNKPAGQRGQKSPVQMNKSSSSLYLWYLYFWSKKINQTAQPIIRVGCEKLIVKAVKALGVLQSGGHC